MSTTRKGFLGQAAAAGVLLAGGGTLLDARPARATTRLTTAGQLSSSELATLAAWCDRLAPGANAAGVGAFVNAQLAKHPDDALLGIRYFGWPPPWLAFYRAGIAALDGASAQVYGKRFTALATTRQDDLHQRLLAGTTPWSAPAPFFLFYLVTRSDAVDVVYGTRAGFARINYPYNPQVEPKKPW